MRANHLSTAGLNQRGDTIVEVLISIVIIATILTGAFLVSRASLRNERNAEEHGQALNLLQGQIEQLRSFAPSASDDEISDIEDGAAFCFTPEFTKAASSNCDDKFGANNLYSIKVKEVDASKHTFTGTVTWPSLNGGTNQEQLNYRIGLGS